MSNEFENDPAWGRDRYTYRDSDGDKVRIEAAEVPKGGEDILVNILSRGGTETSAWANARELIAAAQKAANLDITIIDNKVYTETHGVGPEGWNPTGIVSEVVEPEGEDPLGLLIELHGEQVKSYGLSEITEATMDRIVQQARVAA